MEKSFGKPEQKEVKEGCDSNRSIPVICSTASRSQGDNIKPRGIHLNPKFFPVADSSGPSGQVPTEIPPMIQPQYQYGGQYESQYRFQRFPHVYHQTNSYRQPFQPFHARPRFPQNFNGHPRPSFSYRPPFPPQASEFQGYNANGYEYENFYQGFHQQRFQRSPVPPIRPQPVPERSTEFMSELEPKSGPSYYAGFDDLQSVQDGERRRKLSPSHDRRHSRSRSMSSYSSRSSSRRGRSESNSSRSQRSRSISPVGHSRNHGSPHSSKYSSSDETIWDSDNGGNSDSELDLSKNLELLADNVSDSRRLLKNALKCLGRSRINSMIPVELREFNMKELIYLCRKLLDETDSEELIKVMEGNTVKSQAVEETEYLEKSAITTNESSESEETVSPKKLRKKKKAKKRKKSKRSSESETESENESQEITKKTESNQTEEATTSLNLPKISMSQTAQQSLLELIQIEYKTKAINVMLKNLGVASDITKIVSNVLTTGGERAAQMVLGIDGGHSHNNINNRQSVVGTTDKGPAIGDRLQQCFSDSKDEHDVDISEKPATSDSESDTSCDNNNAISTEDNQSRNKYDLKLLNIDIDNDILDLGVGERFDLL